MMQIIHAPDTRLRCVAKELLTITDDERAIADEMRAIMKTNFGVGLAAPQLGIDKRIVVIDVDKIESIDDVDSTSYGNFVLFNPQIVSSEGSITWNEGCLSIPGFKEEIVRHRNIVVTYVDVNNDRKTLNASGLLAVCIQHEIDHLNGILYIDKLPTLKKDIIVKKLKKLKRRGVMVVENKAGSVL